MKPKTNKTKRTIKQNNSFSDTVAKILSILAAIILWFYVIDVQTTQYEKDFYAVPVSVENFDTEQKLDIISGRENTIDVTLRGTKAQINSLKLSDIVASVDLTGISEAGSYELAVSIITPTGISVVDKSVNYVNLEIDKTVGKTIKIELKETYSLYDGYQLGESVISPGYVYISGPEDLVSTVNKAVVALNLGNIKNTVTSKGEIKLMDSSDKEILSPYIKRNETMAVVTVPVLKVENKKVSVVFADGQKYKYSVSPESVTIKGSVDFVESLESIETMPIEFSPNLVATVNLDLPYDVVAYDKMGNSITKVTVNVLETGEEQGETDDK